MNEPELLAAGAAGLAAELIAKTPEFPASFDIAPTLTDPPVVAETSAIETSDPLIAREAQAAGIPVVAPDSAPIQVVAAATEGTPMTIQGEIADGLVAAMDSPAAQAYLTTLVTSGEAQVPALIANAIKNSPKASGILGMVLPAIEGGLVSYVTQVLAKYPPAEVVAWLTAMAKDEARNLGG